MSTRGRKQRAWRTIRVVVEVKVPPANRSTEKDLIYQVENRLDRGDGVLPMPRSLHDDHYKSRPKVKGFTHVFRNEAKRPPERTTFEQLVIRGIYAILSFTMRGRTAERASAMLRDDLAAFLGVET
jgi:hypothetical protein